MCQPLTLCTFAVSSRQRSACPGARRACARTADLRPPTAESLSPRGAAREPPCDETSRGPTRSTRAAHCYCAAARAPFRTALRARPALHKSKMSEEGMTEIDLGPAAEDPLSLLGAVRRAPPPPLPATRAPPPPPPNDSPETMLRKALGGSLNPPPQKPAVVRKPPAKPVAVVSP